MAEPSDDELPLESIEHGAEQRALPTFFSAALERGLESCDHDVCATVRVHDPEIIVLERAFISDLDSTSARFHSHGGNSICICICIRYGIVQYNTYTHQRRHPLERNETEPRGLILGTHASCLRDCGLLTPSQRIHPPVPFPFPAADRGCFCVGDALCV